MTVMLAFLVRIFLVYFAIKMVWSFFAKEKGLPGSKQSQQKESIKRYQSDKDTIEDADFEDVN